MGERGHGRYLKRPVPIASLHQFDNVLRQNEADIRSRHRRRRRRDVLLRRRKRRFRQR